MELPPFIYVLILSFLASLTIFYKTKDIEIYLKLFPPFLFATLLAELVGAYITSKGDHNTGLYNFFSTFEFCFYLWVISLVIRDAFVKRITRIAIPVYAVIAIVNILFVQKIETFHTVTYALGCLLIVCGCIYYFFELFRLPKSVDLKKNPAFWISSGLLFFYCCSLPLYGFINLWATVPFIVKNFAVIVTILNIFLYSLFTISFLCIRTRKYTLSPS